MMEMRSYATRKGVFSLTYLNSEVPLGRWKKRHGYTAYVHAKIYVKECADRGRREELLDVVGVDYRLRNQSLEMIVSLYREPCWFWHLNGNQAFCRHCSSVLTDISRMLTDRASRSRRCRRAATTTGVIEQIDDG